MARNWDDFLQRDLKGITFPRAWCLFMLNTAATITALVWTRRLLPVGKFGIRNVTQTSLYHNFGPIGVAGACGIGFAGMLKIMQVFTHGGRHLNLLFINFIDMF